MSWRHLGAMFLVDVFHGAESTAAATNRLLVVGFYLVNLGFVSLMLRVAEPVHSATTAIEALASKLGAVTLLIGACHLVKVFLLSKVRRPRPTEVRQRRTDEHQGARTGGHPVVT